MFHDVIDCRRWKGKGHRRISRGLGVLNNYDAAGIFYIHGSSSPV